MHSYSLGYRRAVDLQEVDHFPHLRRSCQRKATSIVASLTMRKRYIYYQWLPKPSRKEDVEPRFCPTVDSEDECKSKLTPLMNEDRVVLNLKCNEKTGEIAYFVHYPIGNQGRPFTPMTVSLIKRDPLPRDSLL